MAPFSVLGLFPSFGRIGGVETSGRLAWEPFAREAARHQLFCYGTHEGSGNGERNVHYATSKAQAVLTAMRGKWPTDTVLVWHLGLLKLLPFLRIKDTKVALFLHGIEAWRQQGRVTRRLLRQVSLFLSNSEHTWRRFVSFNPGLERAPHRIVHLGVHHSLEHPTIRPDGPPAALMIGRMLVGERYKGHKEMLSIWPNVLARNASAQLWIVGPGPLRAELERQVKENGMERSVLIYGQVTEEKKLDLLTRCRCLALPSRGEGFGLVYLEAMRTGRPCLVSNVDAGREVVNPPEAGLAVNPDDLSELTDATCRLLQPGSEWDRWSDRARLRYESSFTAEQFQARLVAAVADLNACPA